MTSEKARLKMRDMTQKLLLVYQAYDTAKSLLSAFYRLIEDVECINALDDEDATKFPEAALDEIWTLFATRYKDLS